MTEYLLAGLDSVPPTSWCYWIVEGKFLAGAYPGSPHLEQMDRRMQALTGAGAGVSLFVNLMESAETNREGEPFAAYERSAQYYGAARMDRYPIQDGGIPTPDAMTEILDAMDAALSSGETIYLHCWGGVGRTGTVAACWLKRHGLATDDDVFDVLQRLREADRDRGSRNSPETKVQHDFVANWKEPPR
ncbi:MAG: hypothetical protein N2C14_20475 [Planctomycetales bacterium]